MTEVAGLQTREENMSQERVSFRGQEDAEGHALLWRGILYTSVFGILL